MNIGVLSRPAEEFWKAHPELYRQLERLATPVQDPYASFYEELRKGREQLVKRGACHHGPDGR